MKQNLRSRVALFSNYIEIFIAVIILLGIAFLAIRLVEDIYKAIYDLLHDTGVFDFGAFLNSALKLIIGVEFVKMLAKHTPESVIEVLLFAIARKLIVDVSTSLDIAIGVLSIAVLFALRKYWFSSSWSASEGYVLSGAPSLRKPTE